jgi:hypothetical protein
VNTTGGGTTAKVCLPEGNSITYNLTQMTTLSTGQLYETYTFGAAQTTINGTPTSFPHCTETMPDEVTYVCSPPTGSEYTWPEIVATNLTANVTQLSTADDGNLIIARMTDAAGFCWWVRINVREKTYQEYGNYKLSSEDGPTCSLSWSASWCVRKQSKLTLVDAHHRHSRRVPTTPGRQCCLPFAHL